MAPAPQATLLDKVLLLPKILRILSSALLRLALYPLNTGSRARTLFKDVAFTALRTQLAILSVGQEQLLNKPTTTHYHDVAASEHYTPDTETLESGLKLLWIGSRRAEKVVVFFHGGGYVLSCSPGHFKWATELQRGLGEETAVVVPAYTTAPMGQYPAQLRQAVETLQYLLGKGGKKSSDIILLGDSAGGNLALALCSHILHPHPALTKQSLSLSSPFAGLVLISPWVNLDIDPSAPPHPNVGSDIVTNTLGGRWSSLFLGPASLDAYNSPANHGPASWFTGLEKVVGDVLVWGGGGEVIIDDVKVLAAKLEQAMPKGRVQVVVEPGAAHEEFILEKLLGVTEKAEGTRVVESWIRQRF